MVQALESLVCTFIRRAPLQSAHCSFQHIEGGTVAQMFNPSNAELSPICHLLALLGAHHILHVSRISVNVLISH
jgi:hypothetical protein